MKYVLNFVFLSLLGLAVPLSAEEIVIDFADPMFARLDAEGKRLLSEYAKAYPKIKAFYGNLRMDASAKTARFPTEESLESLRTALKAEGLSEEEIEDVVKQSMQADQQFELRYRFADKYSRIDKIVNHPITPSMRKRMPAERAKDDVASEIGITLLTPEKGYQLSKNSPQKPYFSLNAKKDLKNADAAEGLLVTLMYFDVAPFASSHTLLEDVVLRCPPLIAGKPYVVEYVRTTEMAGEQVVELRVGRTDLANGFRKITLDKNWCMKEIYSRAAISHPTGVEEIRWTRESCDYKGEVDGVSLLKTYRRSEGNYNKNTEQEIVSRKMEFEITNLVPGPVDLAEFDVKQFLPPDTTIGEIVPAKMSTVRIASLVTGLILVFLGFYLNFRNKKRMRNFSTKEK